MKRHLLSHAAILLFIFSSFGKTLPDGGQAHTQKSSISFTENKGQVHDQNYKPRPDVLYGVTTANMYVHIKNNGVSYQLFRVDSWKESESKLSTREKHKEIDKQTVYRIDLTWLNANKNISHSAEEALPGYNNYYSESCPDGALNVTSYKAITIKNIYEGINLHYYEKNGGLKHDYIVSPQADYRQIQLLVEGAEVRLAKDGSLLLSTPLGKVQEGMPVVYQDGKRLSARWKVTTNIIGFEIDNYDPSRELIIDPITRLWGTYYGGVSVLNGSDYGNSCATDASGNAYLAGDAIAGGTVIATTGTHQSTLAGSNDAFVAKFNSAGVRMWGTYFGGSGPETGTGCTTDPSGNVYLTGLTASTGGNAIATPGVFQTTHAYGNYDGYLVKFNSNGIRLWGTYCGGSNDDFPQSCAYSAADGGVYITGCTESTDLLSTLSGHQPVSGGGPLEAFLVKFNAANGTRLWGTFYGSNADDRGFSCTADNSGNVYMSGFSATASGTIIATPASHQPVPVGNSGAYLVKFNGNGVRQWGTYYGFQGDFGWGCATDAQANVYMTGYSSTSANTGTVVATANAYQTANGGLSDAFLVKMNSAGVRQWGTYYGGSGIETGYSCVVDGAGSIYIGGVTSSPNGTAIATPGSHQLAYAGGTVDVFVAKFDVSGIRISGTYYGGAGYDFGGFLALNPTGQVYVAGYTGSSTGTTIATQGSHQPVFGGTPYDAFLVKFDACETAPQPPAIIGSTPVCVGVPASFSTPVLAGPASYTWSVPAGWAGSGNTGTFSSLPGASGVFSLIAENACGVSAQQTLQVTVYQNPTVTATGGTVCAGSSFTIVPAGAVTYSYSSGPVVSPQLTSSYTVTGLNVEGCSQKVVVTVIAYPLPVINAATSPSIFCIGESATLTVGGVPAYTINPVVNPDLVITPSLTTTYSITGTNANGCVNTAFITQNVDACTSIIKYNLITGNNFVTLSPNPTNGVINLDMGSDNEVTIINAIGQIVYYAKHAAGKSSINLAEQPAGFFVLMTGDPNNSHIKFIKD